MRKSNRIGTTEKQTDIEQSAIKTTLVDMLDFRHGKKGLYVGVDEFGTICVKK